MKTFNLSIIFLSLLLIGADYLGQNDVEDLSMYRLPRTTNDCQPDITKNRAIMERYLTDSQPDSIRQATGTNGLLVSQIQVVQSTDSACAILNAKFPDDLSALISGTTAKKYNFTYYDVGDFYFVISTPNPSPDPTIFILTSSALWIYDNNFDLIEGYSF
jgi:hypothetical protein